MHIPVLTKEVLEYLSPKPNENFIDCTLGFGGHAEEILKRTKPNGKVLGIEIDPEIAKKNKQERLIVVNDSYVNLRKIVKVNDFKANGILFDLGLSSFHFEGSNRGFSFQKDEFLDMRFSPKSRLMAYDIINSWPEKDIEEILKEYGEERHSRRIAKAITEARKIKTTKELACLIEKIVPRRGKIHPATRTFQALRIAVNDELENIRKGLLEATEVLGVGGRIVVISFHSLEDRIVKHFFKDNPNLKVLFKKPIQPQEDEILNNPRSRSAKLRAVVKI